MDTTGLEHDPEKWKPVFRKDHAPSRCWSAGAARLARAFRIETVLRAHLADDREVFAASDETHHRAGDPAPRYIGLDDIGLRPIIGGVWALGVHDRAIIH